MMPKETPFLDELIDTTKAEIELDTSKKFIDIDSIVAILVYQGLKILLPELKEWIKLGFSKIVLKRLEIQKRLENFAREKELDFKIAQRATEKMVKHINEKNINSIIHELEQ